MPKIGMNLAAKEIAEELRKRYGGMMTLADIKEEKGFEHDKPARKWVEDLPCEIVNGRRKWRVSDVARKTEANMQYPFKT